MHIRIFLAILICFIGYSTNFAQGIEVDDQTYDATGLAEILLADSCTEISSASFSSSTSVAYFNSNGSDFPLSDGVIIRTGKAKFSEGIYTGQNLSSQENNNTDPDLEEINNSTGQSSDITDVAFLEYEFVPLSDSFSFDFIFASNEYGQWQCVSADVFAFLLTNLNTGETVNLGVIPNTNIPVSVKNIRDSAYNSSCTSHNPDFFDTFNVTNPAQSSINMRGYTVVMTASAEITPGDNYKIRLVIGDSNDADYDSAVLIGGGSFETTVNLGEDKEICAGDEVFIETGLPIDEYEHFWKKDGNILENEQNNHLTITEPGTYEVEVLKTGTNCIFTDEITFSPLIIETPIDISVCDTGEETHFYDLSINDASSLGLDEDIYEIHYFASLEDLENNSPIDFNLTENFPGIEGQKIFIKIFNTQTNNYCLAEDHFFLSLEEEFILNSPNPIEVCYSSSGYSINLNQINNQLINGSTSDFIFSYHYSEEEAVNNASPISSPGSYNLPSDFSTETIWVRVSSSSNINCFEVIEFLIIEHPVPEVSEIEDVIVCEEYVLPEIEHGNYFTESMGEGDPLFAGDVIDEIGTYYIFSGPDENGCYNQSSFKVIVVEKFDVSGLYCGSFTVPEPPAGAFYTAPDGPFGGGSIIPPETVFSSDTTIYYYAEVDEELCRNEAVEIEIEPLPHLDPIDNVVVCNSYELPELVKGEYYSQPGGEGETLPPGTLITSTETIYVYYEGEKCSNEVSFQVSIIPAIEDITACGSYVVPELDDGNFYTEDQGNGELIEAGSVLTTSQRIYFHADTEISGCQNLYFDLTIIPLPPVDSLDDVHFCEDEPYTLPPLENGSYFTESNRQGTQLFPGDLIYHTQDIFINNADDDCMNETSFTVTITPLPQLPSFTDIYTCDPYVLPQPSNGQFYTEPNGQGQQLQPGYTLTSTETLYIYSQMEDFPYCENEIEFTVYVNYVDIGEFDDIDACETYTLPSLNLGNYYTEPGGQGEILNPGDIITESQTLYVYATQGDRFICEGETSFNITLYDYPDIPDFQDIVRCESYTLPELDQEEMEISYFREPGGVSEILPDEYEFSVPGEYEIFVQAKSYENPNCIREKSFILTINPLRELHLSDATICVDLNTEEVLMPAYINTELDEDFYFTEWYLEDELVHTGTDYTAFEPGEYVVYTTKLGENDGIDCSFEPATFKVWQISQPEAVAYVTTPDFSDIANIEVKIIRGQGNFKYSLNGGPFQTDPVFRDVDSGLHTITITNLLGDCGPIYLKVQVLKYPKFFTPNNDGINDTWNITDLKAHNEAKIYIFTRFGQLLKTIKPESEGWDGKFNGKRMPSDDYWFRVDYKMDDHQLQYKANFTLKR